MSTEKSLFREPRRKDISCGVAVTTNVINVLVSDEYDELDELLD